MANGAAVCVGLVFGTAAALPVAYLLKRGPHDMSHGLAGVITPFVVLQLAMFVTAFVFDHLVAPFGVAASLAFLVVVTIRALR